MNVSFVPYGEASRLNTKDSHKRYEEQLKLRETPVQLTNLQVDIDDNFSTPIKRPVRRPPPPPMPILSAINSEDPSDVSLAQLTVETASIRIFDQLPAVYQVIHKYGLHITRDEIEQLINQYGLTMESTVTKQMFNGILVDIVNIHKRKASIGTTGSTGSSMDSAPVRGEYVHVPAVTQSPTFEIKRTIPIPKPIPKSLESDSAAAKHIVKCCISSSERDLVAWPCPNEFEVPLSNQANMTVSEFRLVSCIFPKTMTGNNVEDYPFIILEIKEVGNVISKQNGDQYGFCHMIFDKDIGKFKVFNNDNPDNLKKLYPTRHIEHLSISIRRPDRELFVFMPVRAIEPPKPERRVTFNIAYDPDPLKPIEAPVSEPVEPSKPAEDPYLPITFVFEITYQRRGVFRP